jgi:hypothetical protein
MLCRSVAQRDKGLQEIVLKNDPGCARQGVEVERNRAQTRIALTNDVDRLQQGVFKRFSFFLVLRADFAGKGDLSIVLVLGIQATPPNRLERRTA